ncbi:MAG: hypothetical protein ACJAQW_001943, partial [Paracoccaceae bacterium]
RKCYRPAVAVAQNNRFVGPQLFRGSPENARLRKDRAILFRQFFGPAKSGSVKGDHAVRARHSFDKRKGKVTGIATGPVDQHQIGTAAAHHSMKRTTFDLKDLSFGRKGGLGSGFRTLGAGIEQHAAARRQNQKSGGSNNSKHAAKLLA